MNGSILLLPLYAFVTWKGTGGLSVIRFNLMSWRVTRLCSPTHTRLLLESVNTIVSLYYYYYYYYYHHHQQLLGIPCHLSKDIIFCGAATQRGSWPLHS